MMQLQSIGIARAQEADLDQARKILVDAATWMVEHEISQWRPEDFPSQRVGKWLDDLYIARHGEELVGVFRLLSEDADVWPDAPPSQAAIVLHSLAVAGPHRGQGVGRRLLELAALQAAASGAEILRLDCPSANGRLRRYYQEAGFRYVDDIQVGPYHASRFEMRLTARQVG